MITLGYQVPNTHTPTTTHSGPSAGDGAEIGDAFAEEFDGLGRDVGVVFHERSRTFGGEIAKILGSHGYKTRD
jgi:hypothetical protein